MSPDPDRSVDVIIIGAGLSGLTAALTLHDHGLRVIVLEADTRVGGRTETGHLTDGQWIELGGQWVAHEHHELRRLVERFNLSTTPTGSNGRPVTIYGGKRRTPRSSGATPLHGRARRDVARGFGRLKQIVDAVDSEAPWRTPGAFTLDRQTFDSWIDHELATERGRTYFRTALHAIFAPDPVEVSTLHAAVYLRSGNHLQHLLGIDREAQEERVLGGAGTISAQIANHLSPNVLTGAAVRTITQTPDSVTVTIRQGKSFAASRVVVTLPPPLASRLEYQPALPSERDQFTQRLHSIAVTKLHLVYPTPFWHTQGLSGECVTDEGPIRVLLDNTPPGYHRGVLVGFIEGADTDELALRTPDARRGAFIAAAVRFFGPAAALPIEYLERDWAAHEFARGCYHGHFAPGTWTAYGTALRRPVGRIHWAGTETAHEWTGYMEGAVRSGIRVANEVASLMSS